jgi:hypothetical protein
MATNKGVEIQMITCGNVAIYNMYLPGNRHAVRLPRSIEEINLEITGKELPASRHYLILETGGVHTESGEDYIMPPIQYFFK